MPSNVTTVTTTTYLQVPKVYRKSRSRSRSSSRSSKPVEVVSPQPLKPRLLLSPAPPPSPPPIPPKMADVQSQMFTKELGVNGTYTHSTNDSATPRTNVHHNYDLIKDTANITISDFNGDLNGDYYTLARTPSPPPQPKRSLRSKLIGAWRLEAYVAYPTPSSKIQRPTYPMTKNVTGIIMYTPDGYMSAHMLIPGQNSFKRGEGEEAQWAEAGKRSFAYCGPYYISNEGDGREEILRHTFQVCNLPGWVGDIQVRTWKFQEDDTVLVLGSEEPTDIRGDLRIPVLKWRRVLDNSNGCPPPPMPQIKVSGPGEP